MLVGIQLIEHEPGGGGGSLPSEAVPDARELPSAKHPKRGFHGRPKYIYMYS